MRSRTIREYALTVALAAVFVHATGSGAPEDEAAATPVAAWSSSLLRDLDAWPRAWAKPHISAAPAGLRIEVAAGRTFGIAMSAPVELPQNWDRLRVQTAELSPGASWFVRVYGELRQVGEVRTDAVGTDQGAAGERLFRVEPRLRPTPARPLRVQFGVKGVPGAYAIFADAEFLPPVPRANCRPRTVFQPGQEDIAAVEMMPNLPEPFEMIDWRAKARSFDRLAFDLDAKGEHLPLIWLDESCANTGAPTFGLPSYVGSTVRTPQRPGSQEGIACMGAVLGATLAGIDKSRGEHDTVDMCEAWFNAANGLDLVLNLQRQQQTDGSFWYTLWPHIVFYALADLYPHKPRLGEIVRVTADRWQQACTDLAGPDGIPNFEHTSYDFRTRQAVDNGRWTEPDAAAGVAWLQYAAWTKTRDQCYLDAADSCLLFLQARQRNPYYEVLLPYGALTAARLNAEQGRDYDVGKLLDWCFGPSDCRVGWGVTVGRWGNYDCDGLVGSITDGGGYAFAMNTFAQAGALVPLARYDTRYVRAIGKWMLNAASAARLFYPDALPADHQDGGSWNGNAEHAIGYEGLRRDWRNKSPCATGDPVDKKWGARTNLAVYGSAYVGIFGSIVRTTNVPALLQLDCLATDFFRPRAYPTSLCYNPYPKARKFHLAVGPQPSDLYDAVTHRVLERGVQDKTEVTLPADSAAVITVIPAGSKLEHHGRQVRANGIVIDWQNPRP